GVPLCLSAFPTRRSSDLGGVRLRQVDVGEVDVGEPGDGVGLAAVAGVARAAVRGEVEGRRGAAAQARRGSDDGIEGEEYPGVAQDRKSTRLNSSHQITSY